MYIHIRLGNIYSQNWKFQSQKLQSEGLPIGGDNDNSGQFLVTLVHFGIVPNQSKSVQRKGQGNGVWFFKCTYLLLNSDKNVAHKSSMMLISKETRVLRFALY